jgi:tyrosinase
MTVTVMPARTITQAPLSYRKSVDWLRGPQLAALRVAFVRSMALSDERGFDYWAGLHGLPLPTYCEHHNELFLPWHRAYLYFFELTLKDLDRTVSLPWWDWTSAPAHRWGIPSAYTDAGGNPLTGGAIGALARSQGNSQRPAPVRTYRRPDAPWRLPTRDEIEWILNLGDFLDFSQQIEQVHDHVHIWLGGTLADTPYAAYDPCFWAHHSMVDRLWRLWQLRHPTAGMPNSLLRKALRPFPITVADTVSTTDLGYDYAVFSSRTVLDGQP